VVRSAQQPGAVGHGSRRNGAAAGGRRKPIWCAGRLEGRERTEEKRTGFTTQRGIAG
jgi:hypothetical protein